MKDTRIRYEVPSHYRIFDYWKDRAITKSGVDVDINDFSDQSVEVIIDWGEPCCWACGREVDLRQYKNYDSDLAQHNHSKIYGYAKVKERLQKCHIVPHSIGGSDSDPSNYFLLCKKCHAESPDTENPRNFFRWVYRKRTGSAFGYDFRSLYKLVKEECEEQNKDISTFSVDRIPKTSMHGTDMSLSTMVFSMVDACEEKTCSTT